MKKAIFWVFIAIIVILSGYFIGAALLKGNQPHSPENNYQQITQVQAIENEEKTIPNSIPIVVEDNQPLSFVKPVEGDFGMKFSYDNLIYSKTLQEWTTHSGIDILAARGTPVAASESGIIQDIRESSNKGIEIIIDHKDGYKTVYSNLSSKNMVKVGQKVKKGQVISGIGDTASFEYYEPDHLHFEIYKDNQPMDPENIFK